MNDLTTGGIPSELFVLGPRDDFNCPLCLQVIWNPKSCQNGHSFCETCIEASLMRKKECPICKTKIISKKALFLNVFLKNQINKLKMICVSCEKEPMTKSNRCKWTGTNAERSAHYNNECEFYLEKCPNEGCQAEIHRYIKTVHLEKFCSFRSVVCPDCSCSLKKNQLLPHESECPKKLVKCPNECRGSFLREDLQEHRRFSCPNQLVKCPFVDESIKYGTICCTKPFLRHQMWAHIYNKAQVLIGIQFEENEYKNGKSQREDKYHVIASSLIKAQNETIAKLNKRIKVQEAVIVNENLVISADDLTGNLSSLMLKESK